jgi:hypothetical protein
MNGKVASQELIKRDEELKHGIHAERQAVFHEFKGAVPFVELALDSRRHPSCVGWSQQRTRKVANET